MPEERISGTFDGRASSNAGERAGDLALDGGFGHFAWHVGGFRRETDDYESGLGKVINSALLVGFAGGEEGMIDNRDLSGVSGSLGLVWLPGDDYGVSLSVSRSVKLPNAEELFANGPHIATNAFEIGDPSLDLETNLGAELLLRKRSGRLTGELSLFANRYDGFIFEQITGEEVEGEEEPLRVIRFTQRDAEFRGAELTGLYQTGEPLPRIPPRRYRLGLHYQGDRMSARIEGIRTDRQDRVSEQEDATPGTVAG